MGCFSLKRRYEKHAFLGVNDDFGVETNICIQTGVSQKVNEALHRGNNKDKGLV